LAQQKAMVVTFAVSVVPHDVPLRVNSHGAGNKYKRRTPTAWGINVAKVTIANQKIMRVAVAVKVVPDDVPSRVDAKRERSSGRYIDLGELDRQ
jgi:hypothetical protein